MNKELVDRTSYGSAELIIGPMFAGKTTELFRRLRRYVVAGRRVGFLSMSSRKTSEKMLKTHGGWDLNFDGMTFYHFFSKPDEIYDCFAYDLFEHGHVSRFDVEKKSDEFFSVKLQDVDVIGIDEVQFFGIFFGRLCQYLVAKGKTVVLAGLNGTYSKLPWPTVSDLIPICGPLTLLTAICAHCKKEAHFSRRLGASSSYVELGGEEEYEACCAQCYDDFSLEPQTRFK